MKHQVSEAQARYLRGDFSGAMEEVNRLVDAGLGHDPYVRVMRAFINLHLGNLPEGWRDYESRLEIESFPALPDRPRWRGESLVGKSIMLHMDGGQGDAIQFVRYAKNLVELGATVYVACTPAVIPVLLSCPHVTRFSGAGFDYYVHSMSLPGMFGTTLDTIPAGIPYLSVAADVATAWNARLGRTGRSRIGVCWASGGSADERDIDPTLFGDLASRVPAAVYNLNPCATYCPASIANLGPLFADFGDTAAAIANLDLVITCDTAVAHLAGALGKPVWICLPLVADWRWFLNRDDSPWYPTARLFRQTSPGDWNGVFARVEGALRDQPRFRVPGDL